MPVLFSVGLLCVFILFFDRFKSAFSGRFIDVFLAVELGLMLALFVFIKFYNAAPLRISFVVLALINIFLCTAPLGAVGQAAAILMPAIVASLNPIGISLWWHCSNSCTIQSVYFADKHINRTIKP